MYICGYCGCPCDEHGNPIETSDNFNPDKCGVIACNPCIEEELAKEENRYIIVTREMAKDACDLRLEGQRWKW